MWWAQLMWAFCLALLIYGLFWAFSGPSRGHDERAGSAGAAAGIWLFLMLFLGTWAVGAWIEPVGPVWWGVAWIPFLWAALLIMLIVAVASSGDWGGYRTRRPPRETPTSTGAATRTDQQAETTAVAAVSIFFWVLLFIVLMALVARYAV